MTQKVISLLMALMLAFSVISISAYAEGDDGIEPYAEWTHCSCGASVQIETYTRPVITYKPCKNGGHMHRHDMTYRCTGYTCGSCGTSEEMSKVVISDVCSIK